MLSKSSVNKKSQTNVQNGKINEMSKLFTREIKKSGYCWTGRHKKCVNGLCHCECHRSFYNE